jgi:pimeloyl-ACP methyl ester carboxylesterase
MTELARDENGTRQHEIARIAAPTLVVWGADDLAYDVDAVGRRFAAEIPDARLVVLDDTGHYPHEERPAEVVRALEAFFAEIDP